MARLGEIMEQKETIWAYTFLFFGGTLGFHKFYLGNVYMGIMYAFTFGLFGFGLVYDIFTLPAQVYAANKNIMHTTEFYCPNCEKK